MLMTDNMLGAPEVAPHILRQTELAPLAKKDLFSVDKEDLVVVNPHSGDIMVNQYNRSPSLVQLVDYVEEILPHLRFYGGCWLIQKDHVGVCYQSPGEDHPPVWDQWTAPSGAVPSCGGRLSASDPNSRDPVWWSFCRETGSSALRSAGCSLPATTQTAGRNRPLAWVERLRLWQYRTGRRPHGAQATPSMTV